MGQIRPTTCFYMTISQTLVLYFQMVKIKRNEKFPGTKHYVKLKGLCPQLSFTGPQPPPFTGLVGLAAFALQLQCGSVWSTHLQYLLFVPLQKKFAGSRLMCGL